MRMDTGAPLCRPIPLHATAERIVCSYFKLGYSCVSHRLSLILKTCLWQKSHTPWYLKSRQVLRTSGQFGWRLNNLSRFSSAGERRRESQAGYFLVLLGLFGL